MTRRLSEFSLGDLVATYWITDNTVGLVLGPADQAPGAGPREVDSMVQLSVAGSTFSGGFAAGHTLRNGSTVAGLEYRDQSVTRQDHGLCVHTRWTTPGGLAVTHELEFTTGSRAVRLSCQVTNVAAPPVTLEMLSSVSLMIPSGDQGEETLLVHRIRSVWSAEGRLVTDTAEDLQLEPSWSGHGVRVERFGQVGSLPVRRFFPFVAVENPSQGLTWAVSLAVASSWQLELYRRSPTLCVSGGLADFEFGHWRKTLAKGDTISSPPAWATVGRGPVDLVAQRLVDPQREAFFRIRRQAIAPVFNEFCTSWGQPSQANLLPLIDAVKHRGLEYFVIDAGWYAGESGGWEGSHGDWVVSDRLFPNGLGPVVDAIERAGMVPGLWFEFETCGPSSRLFEQTELLVQRDGRPVTVGGRRFLDMTQPRVIEYLTERVIGLLQRYRFQYLKVDDNESIGLGSDGESLGEALRRHVEATRAFLESIRRLVPGIVIELCASGGHRLEPSMLELADVASFSDAHECAEIPIIAANLHRVMLPAQSLIWAVLRPTDTPERLIFSLAATFLGVPCLSGDMNRLSAEQQDTIASALRFWQQTRSLQAEGTTSLYGTRQTRYRKPTGWQGVWRVADSGDTALAVVHQWEPNTGPAVRWRIGAGWSVVDQFGPARVSVRRGFLTVRRLGGAVAVLLKQRKTP